MSTANSHQCFGCQRQIRSGEPHIHVGLDEWAAMQDLLDTVSGKQGLTRFGMDDLLTFPFCEPCTETADHGWTLEAHEIAEASP